MLSTVEKELKTNHPNFYVFLNTMLFTTPNNVKQPELLIMEMNVHGIIHNHFIYSEYWQTITVAHLSNPGLNMFAKTDVRSKGAFTLTSIKSLEVSVLLLLLLICMKLNCV